MMYVLAVDPGKATGMALLSWDGESDLPVVVWSCEVDEVEYAAQVQIGLAFSVLTADFLVACESFIINAQTAKNSQAPYSLELIGVLKHLCREAGYDPSRIAFQAPVNAKTMFPNSTLKALGTWHRGGEGHALDAIRHGLLRLVKVGWVPRSLLDSME